MIGDGKDFIMLTRAQIHAHETEMQKMRDALFFYADRIRYALKSDGSHPSITWDNGDRARRALGFDETPTEKLVRLTREMRR